MKTPPVDRRINRTRSLLTDALIALVLEKGYEAVTVQDIIDRANVGRSTFYAHFENKEQLLLSGHGGLTDRFFAVVPADSSETLTYGVNLATLFGHAAGNHRLAKAMLGKNSGDLIISHIQDLLSIQFRKTLTNRSSPGKAIRTGLLAEALAAMLVGLLRHWLEHDMALPLNEVVDMAQKMVNGMVENSA
jgi:AcrR family transcriptional regulator